MRPAAVFCTCGALTLAGGKAFKGVPEMRTAWRHRADCPHASSLHGATTDYVELTVDEERAIEALQRLAKHWPKTLQLFSWSGTLHVIKPSKSRSMREAGVVTVDIPNDGGDPDGNDPSA